jgi:hypothetical protein
VEEEYRPSVRIAVNLGGKSPAIGRSHRALQDRPLPRQTRQLSPAANTSMTWPGRQRKRQRVGYEAAIGIGYDR